MKVVMIICSLAVFSACESRETSLKQAKSQSTQNKQTVNQKSQNAQDQVRQSQGVKKLPEGVIFQNNGKVSQWGMNLRPTKETEVEIHYFNSEYPDAGAYVPEMNRDVGTVTIMADGNEKITRKIQNVSKISVLN